MDKHSEKIQDQFTKQAYLFQASHRSAEDAIEQAISVSGVTPDDTVLDVACGPGVLSCAFGKYAKHVTGIDITQGMLDQAKKLQDSLAITNVKWQRCDVYNVPFDDNSFSMIISRYAIHHIENPILAVQEMTRVCKPGGKVVVIDSAPPPDKQRAFNDIELERDPSHTSALTATETSTLIREQGLVIEKTLSYAWEVTAKSLLDRSFPPDGNRERIYRKYEADVGVDKLGMNTRYIDGILNVTFPTLITVSVKQ